VPQQEVQLEQCDLPQNFSDQFVGYIEFAQARDILIEKGIDALSMMPRIVHHPWSRPCMLLHSAQTPFRK
jgi:hypothetical protein